MSGHVGDLSRTQAETLVQFRRKYSELDDHTLLRFLRARQFNIEAASKLYDNYAVYRQTSGIENILKSKLPNEKMFNRLIPHGYHGFDKAGRPIYIEKTGVIDWATVYKHLDDAQLMTYHCYMMEKQIDRLKEGSRRAGRTVDQVTTIIDLKGLGWSARKGINLIRIMSAHDQNYHPERLGKVLIVNAPWVFPWFFKACSAFLDDNTAAKIAVLGKNTEELLQYVDADQLPVEYGGSCKCQDGKNECVTVSDISDLKVVEEKDVFGGEQPSEVVISKRDKHVISLAADEKGSVIDWCFEVASKDVVFSVEIHSKDGIETVVKAEKMVSHKGTCTCEVEGSKVVIVFDNGHSRFTSKTVRYITSTTPL